MMDADGLAPVWRQGICNHHADIGRGHLNLMNSLSNLVLTIEDKQNRIQFKFVLEKKISSIS